MTRTAAEEAHSEYLDELQKLLHLQRDAARLQVAVGAVQTAAAELRKLDGFRVHQERADSLTWTLQDAHSTLRDAAVVQEQIVRAARAAWAEFGELAE